VESREYLLLVDLINARFGGVDTREGAPCPPI